MLLYVADCADFSFYSFYLTLINVCIFCLKLDLLFCKITSNYNVFWGNLFIDSFSTSSCSCSFFCLFFLFCLTAEIKRVHVGWLTASTAASGSWWSCTAPVRRKKEKIIFSGCKINTSKAQRPSSEVWPDSPEWIWQLWRVFLKNCWISEWFQRHVNAVDHPGCPLSQLFAKAPINQPQPDLQSRWERTRTPVNGATA